MHPDFQRCWRKRYLRGISQSSEDAKSRACLHHCSTVDWSHGLDWIVSVLINDRQPTQNTPCYQSNVCLQGASESHVESASEKVTLLQTHSLWDHRTGTWGALIGIGFLSSLTVSQFLQHFITEFPSDSLFLLCLKNARSCLNSLFCEGERSVSWWTPRFPWAPRVIWRNFCLNWFSLSVFRHSCRYRTGFIPSLNTRALRNASSHVSHTSLFSKISRAFMSECDKYEM